MAAHREARVGRRPGNQDTRGQIITAARQAFAEKGFAGVLRFFRLTEKSIQGKPCVVKNATKSPPVPNLLTGYLDTAARENISR